MSDAPSEHLHNTQQGITFMWAFDLTAMIVLVALFALSDVAGDVVVNEIDTLAAGSINAIGLVAIGGINAIGIVSLGMVNSVGIVAIGGVNSVGVIAVGGYQSMGLITIGGVNSIPFPLKIWSATVYTWAPRVERSSFDPA